MSTVFPKIQYFRKPLCSIFLPTSYLKEQTEADPLIILDVAPFVRIDGLVDARVGHVDADPLPEGAGNGVGWVDPAVGVQHVLGNVFGVDAVDGVANVLPRRHDQREGQQAHDGEGVVQPEDRAVDVHVAHLDQVLEAAEHVQHDVVLLRSKDF